MPVIAVQPLENARSQSHTPIAATGGAVGRGGALTGVGSPPAATVRTTPYDDRQ